METLEEAFAQISKEDLMGWFHSLPLLQLIYTFMPHELRMCYVLLDNVIKQSCHPEVAELMNQLCQFWEDYFAPEIQ
jgi:hypothetical protein